MSSLKLVQLFTVQDVNMLCNFAELVVREVEKKHVVRATLYSCHSVVQHTSSPGSGTHVQW